MHSLRLVLVQYSVDFVELKKYHKLQYNLPIQTTFLNLDSEYEFPNIDFCLLARQLVLFNKFV